MDDRDGLANPEGAKGLGETGITGVDVAVANATGRRVRSLPVR